MAVLEVKELDTVFEQGPIYRSRTDNRRRVRGIALCRGKTARWHHL